MSRRLMFWAMLGLAGLLQLSVTAAKLTRVAILPPGVTSPFHSQIAKGAQVEGEAMGFRVEVQATEDETDFAGQVALMQRFIDRKVDAISVNAIDDQTIVTAVQQANRAKIPVLVHNSQTPLPKGKIAEYIGYNQRYGGRACGEYAVKLLQGRGKIFIIDGIPGFHQIERTGGFLEAARVHPGIQIIGEQGAEWVREKATAVATAALQKNPDINLFFCDSDEMAIGASLAAHNFGKKVFTIGIDGNPVTLDEIAKGNITATLGVYPDKMGVQIIKQMKKLLQGEKIPLYLETPAVVIDKNNLEDYKAGKLWLQPRTGLPEILPAKFH